MEGIKKRNKSARMNSRCIKAIDFFCGAGGMTCGLGMAGIKVLAGIDIDKTCRETYTVNNKGVKYLERDIHKMDPGELDSKFKLSNRENILLFSACSPCQYWTRVRTNKEKSKETKSLLLEFQKFIDAYSPEYVAIENVPGLMYKTTETVHQQFLDFLQRCGYCYDYKTINANNYGVPQRRIRYVMIATRLPGKIAIPLPDMAGGLLTVKHCIGDLGKYPELPCGHIDPTGNGHTTAGLSPLNFKRLSMTPHDGGSRSCWKDTDLQIPAYRGKDKSFSDVYGRMFWDRPAPTITTKFYSISNGRFGHPEQDRAISLREGAALQTFPDDYKFYGSTSSISRQIGNAVPPELAKRIGECIISHSKNIQ